MKTRHIPANVLWSKALLQFSIRPSCVADKKKKNVSACWHLVVGFGTAAVWLTVKADTHGRAHTAGRLSL